MKLSGKYFNGLLKLGNTWLCIAKRILVSIHYLIIRFFLSKLSKSLYEINLITRQNGYSLYTVLFCLLSPLFQNISIAGTINQGPREMVYLRDQEKVSISFIIWFQRRYLSEAVFFIILELEILQHQSWRLIRGTDQN